MMGTQAVPAQLFYDFCLEEHVPTDTCFAVSTGSLIWKSSAPS